MALKRLKSRRVVENNMLYFFAVLCAALMFASVLLNILSLPGNWGVVVLAALWGWLAPGGAVGGWFLLFLVLLAAAGEVLEFLLQARGAKKHGSSGKANAGGMLGAFAGAILGAPILFGLGALPGALIGAYCGCLAVELLTGRKGAEARRSAWGAMTGKFAGIIVKMALGLTIFVCAIRQIWP